MIYYFSEINYRGNHAGTKARNDAEKVFQDFGGKPLNHRRLVLKEEGANRRIVSNIQNRLGFIPFYMDLLKIRHNTVIIQYPMLSFDIAYDYVEKIKKHNKVVFLVHDIQSMRRQDEKATQKEIDMLNLADGVILHNRFMEKKLREIGLNVKKVYLLECFDYLFDNKTINKDRSEDSVAFAGNLEKSLFLKDLFKANPDIAFHLYGLGWNQDNHFSNTTYMGSFSPDEIPAKLHASFGLVWDGESINGCSGALGEYTRLNNPHKLSLYLAAGIPVIVWAEAAVAEYVRKEKIGIALDDIGNLKNVFNRINDNEYEELLNNVNNIRQKVINGFYLRRVLKQIEKEMW